MELALTGDPIDAERGYEIGIVNRLAEPGEAVAVARELAAAIARNGPLAIDATKRDHGRRAGLAAGRGVGPPGRDLRAACSARRTRARARPRSPRSASRSGRAARRGHAPSSPHSVASRLRGAAVVAVLAQVDPLPRPEREPAVADRQRERRAEQRRLDVRGHVVRALDRVRPVRRVLGHRVVEPALEVAPHVRRGVLVEGQRRGGVADEQVREPDPQLAQLGQRLLDLAGHEMEPARRPRRSLISRCAHISGAGGSPSTCRASCPARRAPARPRSAPSPR